MITSTASPERLTTYFSFDESVLNDVIEAANRQNRQTFDELVGSLNIQDGPTVIPGSNGSKPMEILEFTPINDYPENAARVLQTPMGSSLNKYNIWQAALLFQADPSRTLFVIGGPSTPDRHIGRLSMREIGHVSLTHDLRPTVDPLLRYLEHRGITATDHMGYSAGSDKAATAIQYSAAYNQHVNKGVLIEPATVVKRSLFDLARKFYDTEKQQRPYIDQSDCPPFIKLWDADTVLDEVMYCARLLRLSNLAIVTALKHDGFAKRLDTTLQEQCDAIITVGWGTASELTDNRSIERITSDAIRLHGNTRLKTMPLLNMYHAGMNDPKLYAAMMLQGLRN